MCYIEAMRKIAKYSTNIYISTKVENRSHEKIAIEVLSMISGIRITDIECSVDSFYKEYMNKYQESLKKNKKLWSNFLCKRCNNTGMYTDKLEMICNCASLLNNADKTNGSLIT